MSHRATTYVKELRVSSTGEMLTKTEKLVLYALADYHQDKMGVNTYPSVMTLAYESLMDERSCRRILDALERKGILERERGTVTGRGHLTFYRFCELDKKKVAESVISVPKKPAPVDQKGDTVSPFIFDQRGAKGGQKGDKSTLAIKEVTVTGTKANTTPPYPPQAGDGGLQKERASDEAKTKSGTASVADGFHVECGDEGNYENNDGADFRGMREGNSLRKGRERAGGVVIGDDEGLIENFTDEVMNACGFELTRRGLRKVIRGVLKQEEKFSERPHVSALSLTMIAMADAWEKFNENRSRLKFPLGATRFFGEGYWRDEEMWPWDKQILERERLAMQASIGTHR